MSAAPGTHKCGFMNGRRQVLAGSPGCFAPACGSGAGPAAGSCSQVPVPGRVSPPSGRVPSLAPTPRGGESRGLALRQGHRHSACVSTASRSVCEVVRRHGTFRGEPCLEEVVGLVRRCRVLRNLRGESGAAPGRRIHQIPTSSLRSGAGGEWVGARLRESDQDFGIQRSRSET